MNGSIDSLPIFDREYYKVELSANRNVELHFAADILAGGRKKGGACLRES